MKKQSKSETSYSNFFNLMILRKEISIILLHWVLLAYFYSLHKINYMTTTNLTIIPGVTTQTVEIFFTVTHTYIIWHSELSAISYIYICTISCIITKIYNFAYKWSFQRYKHTCQNSLFFEILMFLIFPSFFFFL